MGKEKLNIWNSSRSWEAAEADWEEGKQRAAASNPLRQLHTLPRMPGITQNSRKNLIIKGIRYLISHDPQRIFPRYFFKHPLRYTYRFLRSALRKSSYTRDDDFFLYGVNDVT